MIPLRIANHRRLRLVFTFLRCGGGHLGWAVGQVVVEVGLSFWRIRFRDARVGGCVRVQTTSPPLAALDPLARRVTLMTWELTTCVVLWRVSFSRPRISVSTRSAFLRELSSPLKRKVLSQLVVATGFRKRRGRDSNPQPPDRQASYRFIDRPSETDRKCFSIINLGRMTARRTSSPTVQILHGFRTNNSSSRTLLGQRLRNESTKTAPKTSRSHLLIRGENATHGCF